ncbi:unnamed protein product (macronuclear) [Paramecium tetraurelia]|uniref:HTH psq-type domain-containing protein n=1 Tax=Paramecium tetraurelia TaxID=5888 RepID=A0CAQ3_PARTE|nr:uncharacterized protein GSPATT00036651001 [Paramecium tetraurelia]CAK67870.1 unnamed protein product [Paramecium tetraurelia]|eukprot:XP_001435267.1 hypothetical protein (macronuclear) [Paramecium tetraurelia strain d4-2]
MTKNAEKQFNYRAYVKVSAKQKLQLIALVFGEEWKIKKAASFLFINYASAKSIILKHRKNSILKKMPLIPEVRRCHYKTMKNGNHNYNILCLKGGIFQNLLENLSQK